MRKLLIIIALVLMRVSSAYAAIEFTGTVLSEQIGNSGSDATITIPATSTYCIIAATYWENGGYTDNTITLDGQSASLILFSSSAQDYESVSMYGVSGFSTGSSKTFAWDWNGTSAVDIGAAYLLIFFSGVDTADPVRDVDTVNRSTASEADITTPSIDSSATDMMVGAVAAYTDEPDMASGGQTERITPGNYHNIQYACASEGGASPNTTMTANCRQCELTGVSLQAEVAAAGQVMRTTIYR